MMTFIEAKEYYDRGNRNSKVKGRTLALALKLIKLDEDVYGVQHYDTIIVRIFSNNTYQINNGGYYTATTKKHLNTYSGANIRQVKGGWFLGDEMIPFKQDLRLDSKGRVLGEDR